MSVSVTKELSLTPWCHSPPVVFVFVFVELGTLSMSMSIMLCGCDQFYWKGFTDTARCNLFHIVIFFAIATNNVSNWSTPPPTKRQKIELKQHCLEKGTGSKVKGLAPPSNIFITGFCFRTLLTIPYTIICHLYSWYHRY